MIPRETSASIELPVPVGEAWQALAAAAREDGTGAWHFEHADVVLDPVITPGEAAGGSARWGEVDFRVAVHLVPRGDGGSLVLFTAEASEEPHGVRSTAHASAAHRKARHDLEAMAEAVGRRVTNPTA
ncbi:hypothetical protein [Cellulomonas xylanilytica]|uniref:Polyketide cyclase / dehydrase and lipid transport n=1 Tax=Cellulomonas xylanilytica TaxID=233583 RepID=A0A510V6X9_9CELL|nr:hypothetical protein [Cellulomonas xylanilytica]GEK22612.1 hypothetical protein CXY01_31320 [Cellulomonas xylanilytica]